MELRAVRGMHDLYGEELLAWQAVEERVKKILASFGYAEIRTPVLEKREVFTHAVGDETDIVEKQMYQVAGDGEDKLVLRPEGTAAFMRAVVEHNLHQTGKPQRYYYYLSMFRHERPQKGRQRQFHQFGAELINDPSPEADAEIIILLHAIYQSFGINDYEIRINSVGCANCRPAYREKLKEALRPRLAELCPQCQKRFERAPMRILDCKNEACQAIAKTAPRISDCLCEDCKAHQTRLVARLKSTNIPYIEDPNIVRGLDYYIRTAFEFTSNLLGAQSALVGGGRYDGLSEKYGQKALPAVGFGLGMERLMMALEAKGLVPKVSFEPKIFLAALGDAAFAELFPLSFRLKQQGVWADMVYEAKGLKNLLKQADRSGAKWTVVLGEDELKKGIVLLKDMKQGTQEELPIKGLEAELLRRNSSCS